MALSEKQMRHPKFMAFNDSANKALLELFRKHDIAPVVLAQFDVQAGRVVDELVALVLRAEKSRP